MAYDNDRVELEEVRHDIGLNSLTLGLAMLAGSGMVLTIVAMGIGAIYGESAGGWVGILFGIGVMALLSGAVAWFGVVQPQKHFDDINVPAEDDHGHGHDDHHATEVIVIDSHGNRVVTHSDAFTAGAAHEEPGEVNVREPYTQPTIETH
jgi:hypothetical protein